MIWLLTFPFWSPVAMFILYTVWVQQERGGLWCVCRVVGIIALPLDFVLAHTVFAVLLQDFPQLDEWTISEQIARLIDDTGWRGNISRRLAWLLNAVAPHGHQHIQFK